MEEQYASLSMIKDEETRIDKLGATTTYTEALCRVIAQTGPPYTIGIFGSWGSGKSSLMLQMDEKLTSGSLAEGEYKTIWFKPWKYNSRDVLWNAFLHTILQEMAREQNGLIVTDEWKQELKRFSRIAAQMAVSEIGKGLPAIVAAGVGGGPPGAAAVSATILVRTWSKIRNRVQNPDNARLKYYQYVQDLETKFSYLVEKYLETWKPTSNNTANRDKLAIFIDDLDRCGPAQAITVLEALKLYLNRANCIFIIGIDKEVIAKGITIKYGEELQMSGKDYLEKIIQLHFDLPTPDFTQIRDMLRSEEKGLAYSEDMWHMIEVATKCNVRRVKKFVDAFSLIQALAEENERLRLDRAAAVTMGIEREEPGDIRDAASYQEYLVKLLLLQMLFPDFFRSTVSYPQIIPLFIAMSYIDLAIADPDHLRVEGCGGNVMKILDHPSLGIGWEWPDCTPLTRDEIIKELSLFRVRVMDYHPLTRRFYEDLALREFMVATHESASLLDEGLVKRLLMLIPPPSGIKLESPTAQAEAVGEKPYLKGAESQM